MSHPRDTPVTPDGDDCPCADVIPFRRAGQTPSSAPDERDETLWSTTFDALLLVDDERHYLRINGPAAEMLGAPASKILGSRIDCFTPPEHRAVLEWLSDELSRRGTLEGPYEVLRGDGSRSLVEFRAVRGFAPDKHLIVAREVVADIPGAASATNPPAPRLTPREQEVLQLAADGGSTRAIAEVLVLSPGTVKTHFEHVYDKLGVRDRASAVAAGLRRGLIR